MESIRKPYHHGDLRRALIDTALKMLAGEEGWQFTLRELARRAGVSHTASYKHFADKAELLSELALIGFERLHAALLAARPRPPVARRAEYLTMSKAYVSFGLDQPNLYRLMFSADARILANPRLKTGAAAALGVLVDLMEQGQGGGWLRKADTHEQAHAAWAQLHGLTLLTMDGLLSPGPDETSPVDASLAVLLDGLEMDAAQGL